jgi:ureidoglycolate lyase
VSGGQAAEAAETGGTGRALPLLPLTAEAFAPYGDVIEAAAAPSFAFNGGMADRFHDLARLEAAGEGARIGVSIGRARPYSLPLTLALVERHPFGSQAFVPLSQAPFVVVVAPDEGGRPGAPLAFLTAPGQGVNYHAGVWHGVLTPLGREQDFLIVDRVGGGPNLEEHVYDPPWTVGL